MLFLRLRVVSRFESFFKGCEWFSQRVFFKKNNNNNNFRKTTNPPPKKKVPFLGEFFLFDGFLFFLHVFRQSSRAQGF